MLNYSGTGRINYAEVLHSIGYFIDQNNIKEVVLLEVKEGFLLKGIAHSEDRGGFTALTQEYLFTHEDIAQIVEATYQRQQTQGGPSPATPPQGAPPQGNMPPGGAPPSTLPPGPSTLPPGPSTLPPGPGTLPPGPGQGNPQQGPR
jgi:hypothetical protein